MFEQVFNRSLAEWAFLGLALVIAIPVHEFAHAWAARWAGDRTAEAHGRVTLDPLKHLDPLGTIMILFAGFGWGKPVPVNPYNFRNPRWGSVVVSAAGPAANILVAVGLGAVARLYLLEDVSADGYFRVLLGLILVNLQLALFNLLPVPPLDGSKVFLGLLPNRMALAVAALFDKFGLLFLVLLMITGVAGTLIRPPARFLFRLILGVPL